MADPREMKDALEGLEKLYKAGKGAGRMIKDVLESFKTDESPTFTVKEGLKFKRVWYCALRAAESYIQAGEVAKIKELVSEVCCRDQRRFQWGICQLLGWFATDFQSDLKAREAEAFLRALHKPEPGTDSIWKRCTETDKVFSDTLRKMDSNNAADAKGV
ncbi:hypothetical protein BGZ72_001483 [Mortierella alpina]|nr:hypothetical protein BGZ72_001483 [Mortierella alpina]